MDLLQLDKRIVTEGSSSYADPKTIALPEPMRRGGLPLMDALMRRSTQREFSPKELPAGLLSNLLWAAFGINRQEGHKRTAPSAHDWEEMDIYLSTARGLYLYDALAHGLRLVSTEDLRSQTGIQSYVGEAPLNLVYVADLSRMTEASAEERQWYAGPDAGFIAENVYLFCASEGLATVVRALVDWRAVAKAMGLRAEQQIVLAQSVGYPATV